MTSAMTFAGWFQIALFCALVLALVVPLGAYMTRVFSGERTILSPLLAPVENGLHRAAGIRADQEQHWLAYAAAMIAFQIVGFVFLYGLIRLQPLLPLNPNGM